MPNHVTNELIAPKHVIDSLRSEDSEVDFNTVVPMPAVMRGESALHITDWARIAVGDINVTRLLVERHRNPADSAREGDWGSAGDALKQLNISRMLAKGPFPKDFTDKDFEALIQQMRALREFGNANWYDWSVKHWGTKWNAYEIDRRGETAVRFKTAWSAPIPVLAALAQKFPDAEIRLRWADEDFGANVGDVTVRGESLSGGCIKDNTPEAHTLAFELVHDSVLDLEYYVSFDPVNGLTHKGD